MQWCVEEALMLRANLEDAREAEQAEQDRRVADAQAQVAAEMAALDQQTRGR